MIRGVLGRISGDRLHGWAFDDTDPSVRLTVRVRLGEQELGRTQARIPRADLQGLSGRNDGAHGYTLGLSLSLAEPQLAELVAEASHPGTDEWQRLPRYRPELSCARPPAPDSQVSVEETTAHARGKPISRFDYEPVGDFWTDIPDRLQIIDDSAFPVFVVGAPRSGTSALFAALTGATRYRGFSEGHLLDIAARLNREINDFIEYKHLIQSADAVAQCHLARDPYVRLRKGLQLLLRVAADGYKTRFWIDKTPTRDMVQSVPVLAETWPKARFVFMKRRGLENLMSRLRKFPGIGFEAHCVDWAAIMYDWRKVRSSVPGKFVEIEQRSLLLDPVGWAERVGAVIGLDEAEIRALGARLSSERAEMTDPTAQIFADISETGWSAEMIEMFRATCGPEMDAYGYTYDGRYSK